MKACKVYHTIVLQMFSGRYCRMVKELKLLAFGLERHAWLLSCTLFFSTNFLVHFITLVYFCNQLSQYQLLTINKFVKEFLLVYTLCILQNFILQLTLDVLHSIIYRSKPLHIKATLPSLLIE